MDRMKLGEIRGIMYLIVLVILLLAFFWKYVAHRFFQ